VSRQPRQASVRFLVGIEGFVASTGAFESGPPFVHGLNQAAQHNEDLRISIGGLSGRQSLKTFSLAANGEMSMTAQVERQNRFSAMLPSEEATRRADAT
jgi:hypothetical protein